MDILLCYFSATGNTAAIAKAIEAHLTTLGNRVTSVELTYNYFSGEYQTNFAFGGIKNGN